MSQSWVAAAIVGEGKKKKKKKIPTTRLPQSQTESEDRVFYSGETNIQIPLPSYLHRYLSSLLCPA